MSTKLYEKILKTFSEKRYLKYKLNQAIIEAKKQFLLTGKRHYVVCSNKQYFVVNNAILDTVKKKNGKKFTSIDIMNEAIYITPQSTLKML